MTKCPECGNEQFKYGKCIACGHAAGGSGKKYPTANGRVDTIIRIQCTYTTGSWQCQHGGYASDSLAENYHCSFHTDCLKRELHKTGDQWEALVDEVVFIRKHRHRGSWGASATTPFWFKPIGEIWKALTGLPQPEFVEEPDSPIDRRMFLARGPRGMPRGIAPWWEDSRNEKLTKVLEV